MAGDKLERGAALLPAGKIPWERIAAALPAALPADVLLGPAQGEDAALVRIGDETWAVAADPITFAARDAGRLAVIVNANDVAVRGARPRFFTAVLLVPPHEAREREVQRILGQLRAACEAIGVTLIGGHSEVTPGLPRTIIAGTMLGRVEGRPITTSGVQPGDRIGLSKHAGLEGTAILLDELGGALRAVLGAATPLRPAAEALPADWLSVLPEARIAAACPAVHALHDVTEGGVAEALFELAAASRCHLEIDAARIPVLPETAAVCAALSLDPLGLIGSGALLVACAEEGSDALAAELAAAGIRLTWIGRAGPPQSAGPGASLPRFPRDELLKRYALQGIEAVLLDMDGTLIDAPYDWHAIIAALGISGRSIIDELNALPGGLREERWALLEAAEAQATAGARIFDGVPELLALLRDRGLPTALVTNNSRDNATALVRRFGLQLDQIVTRDDGCWKPSGAPFAAALRRLGVAPERALVVGDSRYDLAAAREAGCARVAILGRPRLAAQADLGFADVRALLRYLQIVLARPA